ncbi:hypothetical protein [Xanthobacter sp. KR7-225]
MARTTAGSANSSTYTMFAIKVDEHETLDRVLRILAERRELKATPVD